MYRARRLIQKPAQYPKRCFEAVPRSICRGEHPLENSLEHGVAMGLRNPLPQYSPSARFRFYSQRDKLRRPLQQTLARRSVAYAQREPSSDAAPRLRARNTHQLHDPPRRLLHPAPSDPN